MCPKPFLQSCGENSRLQDLYGLTSYETSIVKKKFQPLFNGKEDLKFERRCWRPEKV